MSAKTIILTVFLVLFGTAANAADCNSGGRYEVNGYLVNDGTVTDCRTGLIWLQDADCKDNLGLPDIDKSNGWLNWYDAMKWVRALHDGHCGLLDGSIAGDWRLPTRTEWMAMVAYAKNRFVPSLTNAAGDAAWTTNGDAFDNVQPDHYWSSMSDTPTTAWIVYMFNGTVSSGVKAASRRVWPVRAGQIGIFESITIQ